MILNFPDLGILLGIIFPFVIAVALSDYLKEGGYKSHRECEFVKFLISFCFVVGIVVVVAVLALLKYVDVMYTPFPVPDIENIKYVVCNCDCCRK